MHQTRILIVDDQVVVRKGIKMFLTTDSSIQIVGEAASAQDAIRQAKTLQPDVVLMDLIMPEESGIEAIYRMKCYTPNVKIVVLTMSVDETHFRMAMKAGADGYLSKNACGEELLEAIHAVLRGDVPIDPRIARNLPKDSEKYEDPSVYRPLTTREKEILQMVARGLSTRDIGQALNIRGSTVKTHLRNIFTKLNVSGRTEAVFAAMQLGLISLEKDRLPSGSQHLIILRGQHYESDH